MADTNITNNRYACTPEAYLQVKLHTKEDIDLDALHCALGRARALCLLISSQFEEKGTGIDDTCLASACWALEGLIDQAGILISGSPRAHQEPESLED